MPCWLQSKQVKVHFAASKVDDRTLNQLNDAGVRGVRINPLFKTGAGLADCPRLADRIEEMNRHLEIFLDVSTLDTEIMATFERLPVPLVCDHMGYMPVATGLHNLGFRWLLERMTSGEVWAKLSGAYYLGRDPGPDYSVVAPIAQTLIDAKPARCLWATNWPHPMTSKPMANDGDLLDLLAQWTPDSALQRRILVDNPSTLYGFPTE